jgi:hypothetical protein
MKSHLGQNTTLMNAQQLQLNTGVSRMPKKAADNVNAGKKGNSNVLKRSSSKRQKERKKK